MIYIFEDEECHFCNSSFAVVVLAIDHNKGQVQARLASMGQSKWIPFPSFRLIGLQWADRYSRALGLNGMAELSIVCVGQVINRPQIGSNMTFPVYILYRTICTTHHHHHQCSRSCARLLNREKRIRKKNFNYTVFPFGSNSYSHCSTTQISHKRSRSRQWNQAYRVLGFTVARYGATFVVTWWSVKSTQNNKKREKEMRVRRSTIFISGEVLSHKHTRSPRSASANIKSQSNA